MTAPLHQRLVLFLASGFGVGYLPGAKGTYGSLVGVGLYFAQKQLPELAELQDETMLINLFGLVIIIGIIISWISTSLAVRKYLRLKSDDLYY